MKITTNMLSRPCFFRNFFCIIKERQAAFVCISKNACTSLKAIAIYHKTGLRLSKEWDIHQTIGFTPDNGYLVPVGEMPAYEKSYGTLLKFAVWRDPVERLVSAYKWFILAGEYRVYFKWVNLYQDFSFDRFIDFAAFELGKSDPENQDEHIRRQSDYYRAEEVDRIVPLEKLDIFLLHNRLPVLQQQNETANIRFVASDQQKERIHCLYEQDYDFMESNKGSFFR